MSRLAVLLALPLVAAAEPKSPTTHQVQLDGQTFTLPAGFTIERVAGPPLVDRPIVASFDDRGRLYVADSSGSNEKPTEQLKHPDHRIVRLEDTKGTGVFDKATVFADKMMFPEGILWHRGSVYVGAPPHIWKLTDTDDDGVADKREVWFDGKTVTGCANDLHGPYLGPDGWIYWCKGAFAKQEYTLPNGKKFTTRASHIFRARPDGTGIEPVMTGGMDNPVGVAFLPNGERFFTTTFLQHPAAGKRDGIIHAVYGGIWGKDHDVIYDPDHKWTGPNLMPVMTHLGPAAPCGLHCYESNAFGPEYTSNLFACQFNLRKVSRHVLKPSGSTYTTEDSDFLVSDSQDFHPTDVIEDADGSLLVVNTGGWYKLCCPSSQLVKADVLGAIYRVRKEGAHGIDDPRGTKIDWAKLSVDSMTQLLRDSRPVVRHLASERLVGLGAAGVRDLRLLVLNCPNPVGRQNGIWTLSQIDHPSARSTIRELLQDRRADVRLLAAQVAGLHRDRDSVPGLLPLLVEDSPITRRIAAQALGRIGDKVAVPLLLSAAAKAEDRASQHAALYALIEIGDVTGTLPGTHAESAFVRRSSFLVLDQIGYPTQVNTARAYFHSDDGSDRAIGRWLFERHPEWADQYVEALSRRIGAKFAAEEDRDELVGALGRQARTPAGIKLIASVIGRPQYSVAARQTAFSAIARSGLKELPEPWAKALVGALDQTRGEGLLETLTALRSLPVGKQYQAEVAAELSKIIHSNLGPEVRLAALAAFPVGSYELNGDELRAVLTSLDQGTPAHVRMVAAEVLIRCKVPPGQWDAMIHVLPTVGPLELDRVLAAFAQTKDDTVGLKLVAALNNPALRSSLRADGVKERIKQFGPAVQKEAEKLYATLNAEYEQQRSKLDEVAKTLKPGDVRRGQAVFNSTKTSCIACHTIGYVGGKIGPDLTRIGAIRQERDLLESILFPSASFVRSYEPLTVRTKDGQVFNGVPKKDAPDEIVLILAADKEQRIAREDIEEVQLGKVSIMPAGLDKQLSEQELADLIAFLKACK